MNIKKKFIKILKRMNKRNKNNNNNYFFFLIRKFKQEFNNAVRSFKYFLIKFQQINRSYHKF